MFFSPSQQVRPLHSYRATLIPAEIQPGEIEFQADQGLLPTLRVKAPDADAAMAGAYRVSGKGVLKVERIEVAA